MTSAGALEFTVYANMADPEAFAVIAPLDTEGAEFTISVPEPSALAALGSGIAMLALLYRRRRYSDVQ